MRIAQTQTTAQARGQRNCIYFIGFEIIME